MILAVSQHIYTHRQRIRITLFWISWFLSRRAGVEVSDGQHGSGILELGAFSLLHTNAIICLETEIEGHVVMKAKERNNGSK